MLTIMQVNTIDIISELMPIVVKYCEITNGWKLLKFLVSVSKFGIDTTTKCLVSTRYRIDLKKLVSPITNLLVSFVQYHSHT